MRKKPTNPEEVKKQLLSAIRPSVATLRKIARYRLEPSLSRRIRELGERKEFLKQQEHAELVALVDFAQQRTLEKLEAKVALKRLSEVMDGLVDGQ